MRHTAGNSHSRSLLGLMQSFSDEDCAGCCQVGLGGDKRGSTKVSRDTNALNDRRQSDE